MIILNNILSFIVIFSFIYSQNYTFDQSFGQIVMDEVVIDNPFSGGLNKPKIQWVDWDNDGDDDLFVLDEDGRIRYFKNNNCYNGTCNFELVTTSFQNINNITWFYFADYDGDGVMEIITQNPDNIEGALYYENEENILIPVTQVVDVNGIEISIQSVMTPTFADIDGDSDLDLFSGNVVGTVTFYENIGNIEGIPVYEYITNFWQDIYIVGPSMRHGASAISFIDLDNDLDLDLAWGDYYQQSLYIVSNIGDALYPVMDIDNIIDQYPVNDPIVSAGLNMPTFTDIDSDGDQDLFITVLSGAYGYQLVNNFYYFNNISLNEDVDFEFITNDFINSFDLLSDVNPDFVDIDNDNDLDMVVGTDFDPSDFPWSGKLVLFENVVEDGGEPVWELQDYEYLGDDLGNNLNPCFVDIDADLDKDLFVGNFNGTLLYFENIGNSINPEFILNGEVGDIDLSGYSSPEFIDFDNDNDYDLLLGDMSGSLFYYENVGDSLNYNFNLVSDNYQGINVGYRANPLAFDFDSDSDLDLFVGSGNGGVVCYENIGTINSPLFVYNNEESYLNVGRNTSPELYNSSLETGMIIGLSTGGMYYLPICNIDLNNDGDINIVDVVVLINAILEDDSDDLDCFDINGDGTYDVLDVVSLVNYIFEI